MTVNDDMTINQTAPEDKVRKAYNTYNRAGKRVTEALDAFASAGVPYVAMRWIIDGIIGGHEMAMNYEQQITALKDELANLLVEQKLSASLDELERTMDEPKGETA